MRRAGVGTYNDIQFEQFKGFANKANRLLKNYPYFILNMDIQADGSLTPRKKLKKLVDLPNAHSPFKLDTGSFLVANSIGGITSLYYLTVNPVTLKKIADLGNFISSLWCVQIGNKVFISCLQWNGILDFANWQISKWKVPPDLSFDTKEASEYNLADAIEMPKVSNLCLFRGTIFGIRHNKLYHAEPLIHTFSRPYYFYEFQTQLTALASTNNYMFIGGKSCSYLAFPETLNNKFVLRFERVDFPCLSNSALALHNNVFFLTGKAMCVTNGQLTKNLTFDTIDVKNEPPAVAGKISNNGFLAGGQPTAFKDKVVCEVIRKAEKD